jgi:hypothetical protein
VTCLVAVGRYVCMGLDGELVDDVVVGLLGVGEGEAAVDLQ